MITAIRGLPLNGCLCERADYDLRLSPEVSKGVRRLLNIKERECERKKRRKERQRWVGVGWRPLSFSTSHTHS